MKRKIVTAAPGVDPASAAWIRARVLSRTPATGKGRRWDGPDLGGPDDDPFALIDVCACQWGPCGYCGQLGDHDRCPHRLGNAPAADGTECSLTYRGRALAGVWVRQVFEGTRPACRWVCPCEVCETIGRPLLVTGLPAPARIRGAMAAQRPLF